MYFLDVFIVVNLEKVPRSYTSPIPVSETSVSKTLILRLSRNLTQTMKNHGTKRVENLP